jgi:hypothetical protein
MQMSNRILNDEHDALELRREETSSSAMALYGFTASSDAFRDTRHREIINFCVTSTKGSSFINAIDASSIYKSAENIAKFIECEIKKLPGSFENCVVICTDSAANCKAAGQLLQSNPEHDWVTWLPCTAHVCDLYLEDVGKMPWISSHLEKVFIMNSKFFVNSSSM